MNWWDPSAALVLGMLLLAVYVVLSIAPPGLHVLGAATGGTEPSLQFSGGLLLLLFPSEQKHGQTLALLSSEERS